MALTDPKGCNSANASENTLIITDADVRAVFDRKQWTVAWFWINKKPLNLKNKMLSMIIILAVNN